MATPSITLDTAIKPFASLDLGGAEISAFSSDHLVDLVITGGTTLKLVDLSDPTVPSEISFLNLDGPAQSVDVAGDLVAVAVADPTDPRASNGKVSFFRLSGSGATASLTALGSVTVGALPDSLKFNGDGSRLVVANEGEAIDSPTTDAVGSISIIDTSSFSAASTDVTGFSTSTIGFTSFNDQSVKLNLLGIRISEGSSGASVEQDLEPEFVAILGDTAYITLQENNAIAEVDIPSGALIDIWSLGIKDWSRGTASAENIEFTISYPGDRPDANGDGDVDPGEATAGGLSGAWYGGEEDGAEIYYVVTDRGPQAFDIGQRAGDNPADPNLGEKIFDDPDFSPTVYKLAKEGDTITQLEAIVLQVPDGDGGFRPATGIGQLSSHDKAFTPVGVDGAGFTNYDPVPLDAFGIDSETVNVITVAGVNDGNPVLAIADEYVPQIALFDLATGNLVQRYVPSDTEYSSETYEPGRGDAAGFTSFTLPAAYSDRRANRGFEGMAFNSDDGLLYAFIQSPMRPPGWTNTEFIRILAVDPATGTPQAEYLHLLSGETDQDKIGDAVYDAGRGRFLIIERDSAVGVTANKSILELDFTGATNVLEYTLGTNGSSWADLIGVSQPELLITGSIADALAAVDLQFVHRVELLNIPSVGADPRFDKPEGLALQPDGDLVVFFDNDFLNVAGRPDNLATEISFTPTPIDSSDRDEQGGALGVKNLYGLPMADGVDAFAVNGATYVIVAGEGDDRDGGGIVINDAERAANVSGADTGNLGNRLKLITTEGDYDGDGIIEQAYAFGSRSFRIYDANGNLIFDSGNQLAELAKAAGIYDDGRSDDKGTEPETVITQVINGSTYAFVALERGITSTTAVFDVSDPYQPSFVRLLNSPGSVSPEGLEYVSTEPNGSGFLTAANEVSGTFDLFEFSRDVKLSADRNEFNGGPAVEMAVEFDVSGFTTDSIYTIGESNDLQITGIPDGQGAYRVDGNTIRVLVNSELRPDLGYSYQLGSGAELVGARVNFIDVNNAGQVVGGGIAYNTVYDRLGNLVLNSDQVSGGFNRFCSANLVEADTFGPGRGAADRLFLLGEESGNAGSMWILDVANGELWAAPDLGYGSWESATMVDTGRTDTVAYVLGDDFNPGPLYLYLGTKDPSGNVLERNGLIGGQMYYWKSDNGITNHDEAIANGLTQGNSDSGSWVAIDVQDAAMAGEPGYDDEGYKFGDTLRTEVIAGGGFVGYRVEDLDFNPNDPTQLVFNTTGGQSDNGAGVTDRFGSMWILDLEFDGNGDPGATTLKHLYDGDADGNQQAGVRSPDNLAWSGDGFIYVQEDRSTDWEGEEASIFKVDAESGEAERILQINRDAVLPDGQVDARAGQLGAWESSGIIDVSHLYGNAPGTDFFFNVQAHGVGGGAIEEFDLVEGGQILRATIEQPFTLQLLHFADGEAGLLASGTAPNLAALVDGFDDDYANTLILAGGDNFIPGPFLAAGTDSSVAATHDKGTNPGAADIEIHNRIGVEASAIGNHEFDLGTRAFRDAVDDAEFPYISANLDFSGDVDLASRFTDTVGPGLEDVTTLAGRIVPSAVVMEGGEKIGLVGATTQIIESISSTGGVEVEGFPGDGDATNDMALLASQLQPVIDDLTAQGVNKIVLLAHLQQITLEQELAPLLSGVDIIIAAGSNTRLGDDDDVPVSFPGHAPDFAGPYPILTAGSDAAPTLIVNTDNEYTYLGRLVVDFDADGELLLDSLDTTINGAYASTAANVAAVWGVEEADLESTAFAEGSKGAAVREITAAVQEVIDAKDGEVWGFTDVYLEGERNLVRNQETNLGNITADANLAAARAALGEAVLIGSLKNGGGIRAQIGSVDVVTGDKEPPLANPDAGKPEGGVSSLDIENSLRFNNRLMVFDTTPEGLKAILEHGVAVLGNQGRFPQIGGISFSYDPDLAAGSRVLNVAVIDEQGHPIARVIENGAVSSDAPASLSMVTLNFLANGGDSYPFKSNGENFRYLLEDGTLSATIDEALDFTDAAVVPTNALGEQQAMQTFMETVHGTLEGAFDEADTPQDQDERIQNLDARPTDSVFMGETVMGGETVRDVLAGTAGDDLLDGQGAWDTISGGMGNDTIIGGPGVDTLSGDAGRDRFVYNALSDARDLITDFNPAEDLIDFSAILAAPGYDSEDPFNAYIQLRQLAPGLTLVSLDPNGDAANAFSTPMLILQGVIPSQLTADQFIFA